VVPIREWAKAALVFPEWECPMREIKRDANGREKNNPADKEAKLATRRAEPNLLSRDDVKPRDGRDETDQASRRNPRLRGDCRW